MLRYILFCLLAFPLMLQAQLKESGMLSLGARSTISVFDGETGVGTGGQFRLRFSERINSEWYLDLIRTNIEDLASRKDIHIGWSVFFYPFNTSSAKILQPFAEAGHCFDYTRVSLYASSLAEERWSSAVQMGIGTHLNLTERFDLSLKTQYMIHLGSDVHTHIEGTNVHIEKHSGVSLEGHVLTTISVNYKIANLW